MAWMICSGIYVVQLTEHRSTLALNTYMHTHTHTQGEHEVIPDSD